MIVLLRWFHTSALRVSAFVSDERWILLSMVLATLGIVSIRRPLPAWLNIAIVAVSAALFVMEVRERRAKLRELNFIPRTADTCEDTLRAYGSSQRFETICLTQGLTSQPVLVDHVATASVAAGEVSAVLRNANYILPRELGDVGRAFLRKRLSRGATYNGHVVGLDTNLGSGTELEATTWSFLPGRYWDHLASDIMATNDTLVRGNIVATVGRSLFIDRHGRVRDFADSWLLNNVGTSVLAITNDARLVVVVQSNMNESSPGLLAPSGSGSLEPKDMRGFNRIDLARFAANGALRELHEETGIEESMVAETAFLGFARWIEKAAMPELLTIARLNIDSHAVGRARIPSPDRPYTLAVRTLRLEQDISTWDPANPLSVLSPVSVEEEGVIRRLSVPLELGLRLIAREATISSTPAGDVIKQAMAIGARR